MLTPIDDRRTEAESEDASPSLRSVVPSALSAAAVFLLIQFWLVAKRVPLGHDEAVYLLRARDFVGRATDGASAGYWSPYRAPGLPALLSVPMRVVGESVSISRSIVALLGAFGVVATAWLVARLAGTTAGAIAPWIMVMTPAFTSYASLVLLDVPGTLLVVVVALLIERSTRFGRVEWWPALAVPVVSMFAVYTRFGTTTNLAALILAVLVARADLLLATGRRVQTLLRLSVVGVSSAVLSGAVLLVPAMTGSSTSPYRLQRLRQEAKELSKWASYGDMFDLFWPNGSRSGETFTWLGLAVVVLGVALTLVGAARGRNRRAAVAGLVAVVIWIIGLNYALAQMFGNYLGLGVPLFALLAAPGWAYAFEVVGSTERRRLLAGMSGAVVAVVGSILALNAASHQVEHQERFEQFRAIGAGLGEVTPNRECGVITSYVQIAWYADCAMSNYALLHVGYYADREPQQRGVFDLDAVQRDHVYFVLVEGGKRQPTDEKLEELLGDAEPALVFTDVRSPTIVYRILELGDSG